jgi:hypothetical protein
MASHGVGLYVARTVAIQAKLILVIGYTEKFSIGIEVLVMATNASQLISGAVAKIVRVSVHTHRKWGLCTRRRDGI